MSDDTPLFKDSDQFERDFASEEPASDELAVPAIIPVRGDTGLNQPVPLPAVTSDDDPAALIDLDAEPRSGSNTEGGEHTRD